MIRLPTIEAKHGLARKKYPASTSRSSCGVMTVRTVGMATVHMPDAASSWWNKIRSLHSDGFGVDFRRPRGARGDANDCKHVGDRPSRRRRSAPPRRPATVQHGMQASESLEADERHAAIATARPRMGPLGDILAGRNAVVIAV
eukprot:jgi/Tetstr1/464905/TSEL_009639.t1